MIMQCPRCSTRWRVGDSPTTDNPVFKCGRCHHVFPRFPGAPPIAERAGGKTRGAPPEPDNLEFIFPQRDAGDADEVPLQVADGVAALRDIVVDEPPPAAVPTLRKRGPEVHAGVGTSTPQVGRAPAAPLANAVTEPPAPGASAEPSGRVAPRLGAAAPDADEPSAEPPFDLLPDDEMDDDAALVDDRVSITPAAFPTLDVEAMMGASSRSSAFRPVTRLLFSLVLFFAALALLLRADPARTDAWLARVPVLGSALSATPRLGARITLDDVQGGYQRLRTGRRVFVISGKATNNALVPVERIEVEGSLYTASGTVERKVISTGNKTTLKLRDLSESEIALLQNLDARQPVAPGARTDFAIVFLEPPRDLREFSSRVLTARSTGLAPSQPARAQNPPSVG